MANKTKTKKTNLFSLEIKLKHWLTGVCISIDITVLMLGLECSLNHSVWTNFAEHCKFWATFQ